MHPSSPDNSNLLSLYLLLIGSWHAPPANATHERASLPVFFAWVFYVPRNTHTPARRGLSNHSPNSGGNGWKFYWLQPHTRRLPTVGRKKSISHSRLCARQTQRVVYAWVHRDTSAANPAARIASSLCRPLFATRLLFVNVCVCVSAHWFEPAHTHTQPPYHRVIHIQSQGCAAHCELPGWHSSSHTHIHIHAVVPLYRLYPWRDCHVKETLCCVVRCGGAILCAPGKWRAICAPGVKVFG